MRAYLIDATTRTIAEIDYDDDLHEPAAILGGEGRGDFTVGSGPLIAPDDDGVAAEAAALEDGHLNDFLYVRDAKRLEGPLPAHVKEVLAALPGEPPRLVDWSCEIEGNPEFWFQIDADREQPSTFPIPGRGLVVGVTVDGLWCDAEITIEDLRRRVTFTRRRLRGYTTSTGIMPGETWVGPIAPIVEEQ